MAALPMLQQGSFGPEVSALQVALLAFGLEVGSPDGDFGPLTDAAVRQFQQGVGLEPDGIVGSDTWAQLGGQEFGSGEVSEVDSAALPAVARAIYFNGDVDAYLSDLGIDPAGIDSDDIA